MSASTYPVHVDARLDQDLSRWWWLFKWLLAVPHYVVLAFLWIAFAALSVVAFFAILLTGRYPRAIFDFNVGVLRWSWRVAYYAYGALGTDRYPPFTLADRPDYPARLHVDYPTHLSRGLVLVKWWLLAIPHYLVLGMLLGGAGYAATATGDDRFLWSFGLLGLLVLVAGVVLLVTGRYPPPLFDLVLGINRWALRVAGYVALMTDQYPPFRLDQGPDDPAETVHTTPPPIGPPGSPDAERPRGWTVGRITALVVGCLLLAGSIGIGLAGGAAALAAAVARDDAGYVMTGEEQLSTESYALTSARLVDVGSPADWAAGRWLGTGKVVVEPVGEQEVFLGVAEAADVRGYLEGVRHATVTDVADEPVYRTTGGGKPAVAPGDEEFWIEQSSGTGSLSVTWPVADGDWRIVMMNADGSAAVSGSVSVGATAPVLDWLVPVLLIAAGAGLVIAIVLVVLAVQAAGRKD